MLQRGIEVGTQTESHLNGKGRFLLKDLPKECDRDVALVSKFELARSLVVNYKTLAQSGLDTLDLV